MSEGVKNAELVVEAATENIDLKLQIFEQLDKSGIRKKLFLPPILLPFPLPKLLRQPAVPAK